MSQHSVAYHASGPLAFVQIASDDHDRIHYITFAEASARRLIEVREVSDAGSVNEVFVVNGADEPVFLADGDFLRGAKQNRILNTSMLLAPGARTRIPVSCVERGRWHYASHAFAGVDYVAPYGLRGAKACQIADSLRRSGSRHADQRAVWHDVSSTLSEHGIPSPTCSLTDAVEHRRREADEYAEAFTPADDANGMAVFLGRTFLGLDLFHRRDIYREYAPKILRSLSLHAGIGPDAAPLQQAEAERMLSDLFEGLAASHADTYSSVSLGEERRYDRPGITAVMLVYQDAEIHLSVMSQDIAGGVRPE